MSTACVKVTYYLHVVGLNKCLSCTVSDIFSVDYWHDLKMWVRGHSRSLDMAPFDRSHTSSYSSSIVTVAVPLSFSKLSEILVEKKANFSYPFHARSPRAPLNILPKILIGLQTAQIHTPLYGAKYCRKIQRCE